VVTRNYSHKGPPPQFLYCLDLRDLKRLTDVYGGRWTGIRLNGWEEGLMEKNNKAMFS